MRARRSASASHAGPALLRARGPAPGTREFFASADREMLAATFWFDPAEEGISGAVVVRFTGHRKGVGAKTKAGDQFVQDELIDDVRPGGGQVSVTTRVRGINPGEWAVSARILPGVDARGSGGRTARLFPGGWSWPRWSFRRIEEPSLVVRTCYEAFAHVPGVVPLVWGVLALVGFVIALATQQVLLARAGLPSGLVISLVAIAAGLAGAQAKFAIDHRNERRFGGWAVQGFLAVTAVAAVVALLVAGMPLGAFVDASAPGIFLGLALGRVGCFLAGCCGGRPTTSPWGMWSSDQRVGRRRIPTQLLESGAALAVGIASMVAIVGGVPLRGAVFVGALAAYTLLRQGVLRLRAERPPGPARGATLTAALALAVLVADLAYLFAFAS